MNQPNEKHICLDCESAGRDCVVVLNEHGLCPICNSSAVLSEGLFLNIATHHNPLQADKVKSQQVIRERDRTQEFLRMRNEATVGVRSFLIRNKFDQINQWWDGWGYHIEHSVFDESRVQSDGVLQTLEELRLYLKNTKGEWKILKFYFDPEDEGMREVEDKPKGWKP